MNIADANLNLALATNQENGVIFKLYFQEDQRDFMKAFLVMGATINSRTEIIAACPSLPADQCTPNHTLMQSKLMLEGSGKPLNILKSLVGVVQRERLFIAVLGYQTRLQMHQADHATWLVSARG